MNKANITGVKSYGDGVKIIEYDDGRIKVKLPKRKFEHLKSISQSVAGIYDFLRDQGFKSLDSWDKEGKPIPYVKSYNEQHTGHVCYVYRPRPEPEVESVPAKPKKDKINPISEHLIGVKSKRKTATQVQVGKATKPKPKAKKAKAKKKAGK